VTTLVRPDGAILEHILDTTYASQYQGLSRHAFSTLDAAQTRIDWVRRHQQRVALMSGSDVLASAQQIDLTAVLNHQRLRLRGIAAVCTDPACGDVESGRQLVERLVEQATRDGADAAILFATGRPAAAPDGFEVIPTADVVLRVAESPRYGAPMMLVRGGEERDLAAVVAIERARSDQYRFHLDRDVDFVRFVIAKRRLLAGLGPAGARQLEFVIAEEGITAAAYLVLTILDGTWTIEACGDRDASGARVGALLQALIARAPAEQRPTICGWLPPGFVPPQATIASTSPSRQLICWRFLGGRRTPTLSTSDVLYWRSDLF
jgi:hypothetical protein